jgi:hypothetical protein
MCQQGIFSLGKLSDTCPNGWDYHTPEGIPDCLKCCTYGKCVPTPSEDCPTLDEPENPSCDCANRGIVSGIESYEHTKDNGDVINCNRPVKVCVHCGECPDVTKTCASCYRYTESESDCGCPTSECVHDTTLENCQPCCLDNHGVKHCEGGIWYQDVERCFPCTCNANCVAECSRENCCHHDCTYLTDSSSKVTCAAWQKENDVKHKVIYASILE